LEHICRQIRTNDKTENDKDIVGSTEEDEWSLMEKFRQKGLQTILEAEPHQQTISRPRDGVDVMWNSPMLYRVNH